MSLCLDGDRLVQLAKMLWWYRRVDWSDAGMRQMVAELGWQWTDVVPGHSARLSTGLSTGDATIRTATAQTRAGEFGYRELTLPVVEVDDLDDDLDDDRDVGASVAAKADAFRWAADVLTREFGLSEALGAYGGSGPFGGPPLGGRPPGWGTPFRQWFGKHAVLELRADSVGANLVLVKPKDVWRPLPYPITSGQRMGFYGIRGGLPEEDVHQRWRWIAKTWDEAADALGGMLKSLPAEARALGVDPGISIRYAAHGGGGTCTLRITCRDAMRFELLGDHVEEAWPGEHVEPGWRRATLADQHPLGDVRVNWVSEEFAPGPLDGPTLGWMVIATVRNSGQVQHWTDVEVVHSNVGAATDSFGAGDVVDFYDLGLPMPRPIAAPDDDW